MSWYEGLSLQAQLNINFKRVLVERFEKKPNDKYPFVNLCEKCSFYSARAPPSRILEFLKFQNHDLEEKGCIKGIMA